MGCYVAAIVIGSVGMMLLHGFSGFVFPEAAMFKMPQNDPEALRVFMDSLGIGPKLSVVLSHWLGTTVGASLAMRLAPVSKEWLRNTADFKASFPGWVMGVWFTIGGIANAAMVPMPAWMIVLDLVGYVPLAYLCSRGIVVERRR